MATVALRELSDQQLERLNDLACRARLRAHELAELQRLLRELPQRVRVAQHAVGLLRAELFMYHFELLQGGHDVPAHLTEAVRSA